MAVRPAKRMGFTREKEFQDQCEFFLLEKAMEVLQQETPDLDELSLAKLVIARRVRSEDVAFLAINNTAIGTGIDNYSPVDHATGAQNPLPFSASDIQWAVRDQFGTLAKAYKAAGLIAGDSV